jgi:hypothetical protein
LPDRKGNQKSWPPVEASIQSKAASKVFLAGANEARPSTESETSRANTKNQKKKQHPPRMKLLTKEEEEAHYRAVIRGGLVGGGVGLGMGLAGTLLASRRYPAFRSLTLPFKTFLVTSAGTFGAIVNADRWSMAHHKAVAPFRTYKDDTQVAREQALQNAGLQQRFMAWGQRNRYSVVMGSWVASMGTALAIVGRSPYMTTAQKVVQARVYAQGLTLAVLLVTAVFEMADAKKGRGRWETILVVDPNDPEHKHMIEKRVHKEEYAGQDLWMGKLFCLFVLCAMPWESRG